MFKITLKDQSEVEVPKAVAMSTLTVEAVEQMLFNAKTEAQNRIMKDAFELMRKERESMRSDMERIRNESTTGRAVLSVEIGDSPERALSRPAPEYLGRMIQNAKLGLNTLLVGPAGCGKTIAAELLSESLALSFHQVCLTAGASETWLFGRQTPVGFVEGPFSKAYREGGVFLADEIDAADANMLLAINTALANGHCFNPINGEHISKHKDFVFVGGANTVGRGADQVYTGRNRLDAATINRFVVIMVDYDDVIEKAVCPDGELRGRLKKARNCLKSLKSAEVISTRTMDQAHRQKQAGIPTDKIFSSITAGWSTELIEQAGLR